MSRSTATKANGNQPIETISALKMIDYLDEAAADQGHPLRSGMREKLAHARRFATGERKIDTSSNEKYIDNFIEVVDKFIASGYIQYMNSEERGKLASFLEERASRIRSYSG